MLASLDKICYNTHRAIDNKRLQGVITMDKEKLIGIIYNLLGEDIASRENILSIIDNEGIDISDYNIDTIVSELNKLNHQ